MHCTLTQFYWTTCAHCTNTSYLLPLDTMQRTSTTLRIRIMYILLYIITMYRCVHNVGVYIQCIMCIDNCKYVFIVHCVYGVYCMCILHIVFCTVCKYVLFMCKLFLHCLEHALKNFTHQGTRAVVM